MIPWRAWVHQGKTTRWLVEKRGAWWTECSLTVFVCVFFFLVVYLNQAIKGDFFSVVSDTSCGPLSIDTTNGQMGFESKL
jgi:hypothetical protein